MGSMKKWVTLTSASMFLGGGLLNCGGSDVARLVVDFADLVLGGVIGGLLGGAGINLGT